MVVTMKRHEIIKVILLTMTSMLAVEAAAVIILLSSGIMHTQFGRAGVNNNGEDQTGKEVVCISDEQNNKSGTDETDASASTTEPTMLIGSDNDAINSGSTSAKGQNNSKTRNSSKTNATTTTTKQTTTTTKAKDNDGDWVDGWY